MTDPVLPLVMPDRHGPDGQETPDPADRRTLEARWLHLTRQVLPALAAARQWPVDADHCFQRILLDNACGDRWTNRVRGRPAYRSIAPNLLATAVRLAEAARDGTVDLTDLDAQSLAWRGKHPRRR